MLRSLTWHELKSQVSEQTKTYLDTCAEQDTLYPASCPFSYEFSGRVQDNVKWSITEYPTTDIRLSGPNADKWGLMDVNRNLKSGVKIPDCGGASLPAFD